MFFIDLKVQVIYSAFKHVVQVMWTCKTDICIVNLVRLRACLVPVLKNYFLLSGEQKENNENKINTFLFPIFLFSKKNIKNTKLK